MYKGTRNPNPRRLQTLDLQIVEIQHERKRLLVNSRGQATMVLQWNGKLNGFQLRKFAQDGSGRITGDVYNDYDFNREETAILEQLEKEWR